MSEETKEAITGIVQIADGNEKVRYLLKGLQLGLEASREPGDKKPAE